MISTFFCPRFPPLLQKEIATQKNKRTAGGSASSDGNFETHLACNSIKNVSVSAQEDLKHQVWPPRAEVEMEMVSWRRNLDWFTVRERWPLFRSSKSLHRQNLLIFFFFPLMRALEGTFLTKIIPRPLGMELSWTRKFFFFSRQW